MHDAVTGRNHIHIVERGLGPVDKVKTVFVATVFDFTVLLESIGVKTATLNGQGVVNNQLGLYHWVDLGRIATLGGNGITQASQVHQRGQAENVVSHHTGRIPGEVQITLAINQLLQGIGQRVRLTAAHQLLRQNARGIGQLFIGTGLNGVDRLAGIKKVQHAAGQVFTVLGIHSHGYLFQLGVIRFSNQLSSPLRAKCSKRHQCHSV